MRVNCNSEGIAQASNIIKKGGTVVFPTDTVYGIGCDPFNKIAVDKIYEIKQRDKNKPFPVLTFSADFASEIIEFNETSKKMVEKFWPGPLTLILKLKEEKLKDSLGIEDKIAIRVPNNQCLLEILKKVKFLIGTSANLSGQGSFTKSQECYENVEGYDVFVDGGDTDDKGESTILEIKDGIPIIHRQGPITMEEIEKYL